MTAGWEEYTDPRLVALYDLWGPSRPDLAFYLRLAAELPATSVADIGCGTGLLACQLARRGHQVTGVDPSPAMLEVARHRPGGDRVRWIEGDASRLEEAGFDLAVMTGHVAQVIARRPELADDVGRDLAASGVHARPTRPAEAPAGGAPR